MALTPQETAFVTQLKKEGKSKEEAGQALKKMREGGNPFTQFLQGVGKETYNIGSQLSRLAPGDQSADPTSFYSRAKRDMQGADIERAKEGYNPEAFSSKLGEFVGGVAPTIPLGMGVSSVAKGILGLGLKVAPKIASKVAPFVTTPSKATSFTDFLKFASTEGAKDVATYDMLTKGETSLKNVATGAIAGPVIGTALRGVSKFGGYLSKLPETPVINKSKAGAYTEGAIKEGINTAKNMVGEIVAPYTQKIDEVSGIMSAIKPKQQVKNGMVTRSQEQITKEVKLANDLIRKSNLKPKSIAEYNSAIKANMQRIGSEIEKKTKQKLYVNMTDTATKLKNLANNPAIQRLDPAGAKELRNMAARMRTKQGFLKVEDAEFMNQFINDELKAVASASETRKRGLSIIVGDLRDKLDEAVSNIPGEFKDLKKTYGALRNVYRDGISREIVYNRANPEGLISSYSKIEGASDLMSGLMKIAGLDVKGGVADIAKGVTKNKLGQIIKTKNDPNYIINKIFNDTTPPVSNPMGASRGAMNNIVNTKTKVRKYTEGIKTNKK